MKSTYFVYTSNMKSQQDVPQEILCTEWTTTGVGGIASARLPPRGLFSIIHATTGGSQKREESLALEMTEMMKIKAYGSHSFGEKHE